MVEPDVIEEPARLGALWISTEISGYLDNAQLKGFDITWVLFFFTLCCFLYIIIGCFSIKNSM